jgi:3-deoxy-D-manno-octulosonic-acid transferase
VVAASTHPGEESVIVDVHRRLKVTFPDLLTIIAPRHPQRGSAIAASHDRGSAIGAAFTQRIAGEQNRYLCFRYAWRIGVDLSASPIGVMGGSLVRHGSQNPIEAIKFAAIVHGSHVSIW